MVPHIHSHPTLEVQFEINLSLSCSSLANGKGRLDTDIQREGTDRGDEEQGQGATPQCLGGEGGIWSKGE